MPVYHYECKKCNHDFEERRSVDNRYRISCQRCGFGDLGILIDSVSVHLPFEPYFDNQLGCRIKGKKHKREVAKELGLTNVGDAKVHEIERAAKDGEREKDRKWMSEKPTRKFMEAWDKAKATCP